MSFQRPNSIGHWNCCKVSERFFNKQIKVIINILLILVQCIGLYTGYYIFSNLHSVLGIVEQKITIMLVDFQNFPIKENFFRKIYLTII